MKKSCLTSFEIWAVITNWKALNQFTVKSHAATKHSDFETWKQYKDDRGTHSCEILSFSALMAATKGDL